MDGQSTRHLVNEEQVADPLDREHTKAEFLGSFITVCSFALERGVGLGR
jgi:hypothetical protein